MAMISYAKKVKAECVAGMFEPGEATRNLRLIREERRGG